MVYSYTDILDSSDLNELQPHASESQNQSLFRGGGSSRGKQVTEEYGQYDFMLIKLKLQKYMIYVFGIQKSLVNLV